MSNKSEFELARLRKDVTGLIDIAATNNDRMIELEETIKEQASTLSGIHKDFIESKKMPKGLSRAALTLLKSMQSQVTKLEAHMLNNQQYIQNNNNVLRDMAKELKQTVAANDR